MNSGRIEQCFRQTHVDNLYTAVLVEKLRLR